MMALPTENPNVVPGLPTATRGAAKYSPLHVGQMAMATFLLLAAAFLMCIDSYVLGFFVMVAGGILCFLDVREE